MFLDNRQVAMDSALEALADSIDYFQDNLERLRPSLRDALKPHFEERGRLMRELQSLARRHLDLLPRDADVERDDYMWLWSRLKSFVGNDSQVLINELLEQDLANQCHQKALTFRGLLSLQVNHQHLELFRLKDKYRLGELQPAT